MELQRDLKHKAKKLEQNIKALRKLLTQGRLEKEFADKKIREMKRERTKIQKELEKRTKGLLTHQPFEKLVDLWRK